MRHCLILFCVCASYSLAAQQATAQNIPAWRISDRPRLIINGLDNDLFRIRAASFLPGDRIVVADGGNSRLVYFSPRGQLQQTVGRSGSGPSEFRSLWAMFVFGDTVVTYDPGLYRLSRWIGATLKETIPLPTVGDKNVEIQGATNAREFLAVTLEPHKPRGAGLFVDTVTLVRYDARAKSITTLGRREWRYLYFYPQENGSTTYRTPFLPSSYLLGAAGTALFVTMSGDHVEIFDAMRHTSVKLPLSLRRKSFDRNIVTRYRDSLLNRPGSEGSAGQRLRDVFGDKFPAPRYSPRIRRVVTVGPNVWIETAVAARNAPSQWLVVNPSQRRIIARISLPPTLHLLGGDESRIIGVQRDELDVESVVVYDVRRNKS